MGLSINQNISAINSHRNLQINDARLTKSLEKLSSGFKINRASEGPASLQISEHFRSQLSGLKQSIDNSETAITLVQTTESALAEVNSQLVEIRSLLLNSANEGTHDSNSLDINKKQIEYALDTIRRISKETQFGEKVLLDGSNEASIYTTGEDLDYDSGTVLSRNSPEAGYEVKVLSNATRSKVVGKVGLTQEMVERGEELLVIDGNGLQASYTTKLDDTVESSFVNLENEIRNRGLQVDLGWDDDGKATITAKKYGKGPNFQVSSSTAGVLSTKGGTIEGATPGRDINGTINGEPAKGEGQLLTGLSGVENVDGVRVRYSGEVGKEGSIPPNGESVGRVFITQKSWRFKVDGYTDSKTTGLSVINVDPTRLARNVKNESNIAYLADISIDSQQETQDSILVVDRAMEQISKTRGDLGSFQKLVLEANLFNNRISNENLTTAVSVIRDTDTAKEMAEMTRNKIVSQANTAMLAHANQSPARLMQVLQQ